MALSNKSRRRWSLIILLVGLPIYIIAAVSVINMLERPNLFIELVVYVVLGIVWILPFKSVFRGIGQADTQADTQADSGDNDKREEP